MRARCTQDHTPNPQSLNAASTLSKNIKNNSFGSGIYGIIRALFHCRPHFCLRPNPCHFIIQSPHVGSRKALFQSRLPCALQTLGHKGRGDQHPVSSCGELGPVSVLPAHFPVQSSQHPWTGSENGGVFPLQGCRT